MHHDDVAQERALSWDVFSPAGGVVVTTVHAVPFQVSTSAWRLFDTSSLWPTALHHVEERHETAVSCVAGEPGGFTAFTMLQAWPSHCSTSGLTNVEPGPLTPTATQKDGPAHDTP